MPEGRFCFFAGQTARKARTARGPVPFGEFQRTLSVVLERIEDILAAEEGSIWLRVYMTGSEHHTAQIKIEGVYAEQDDALDVHASDASMAGALVTTIRHLLSRTAEQDRALERHHQHQLQSVSVVTQLAIREGYADLAVRQAAAQQAVKELAPVVATVLGGLAAGWGGGAAPAADGGPAPSASPAERVQGHVQAIVAQVSGLAAVLQASGGVPPGAEGSISALRDLVQRIGPALGLAVTPVEPEQAAAA